MKRLCLAVVLAATPLVLPAGTARAEDPINYKLDLIIANQQDQNDRIAALEHRVTALEGRGYSPSYSPPTAYQQPTYYTPQQQYQPAYYAPQPVTPAYRYTPPVYPHELPQYSGPTKQAYAPGYYEAQVYATANYRGQ